MHCLDDAVIVSSELLEVMIRYAWHVVLMPRCRKACTLRQIHWTQGLTLSKTMCACMQRLLESLRINQELSRPEVWEEMLMHPIMRDIMREVQCHSF